MIATSIILILFFNLVIYLLLRDATTVHTISQYFRYEDGIIKVMNFVAILLVAVMYYFIDTLNNLK